MGVSGMTGFGRSEGIAAGLRWIWEAKSVNGRGLDVKIRLPAGFDALEPAIREAAKIRFRRGSLQVGLVVRAESAAGETILNHDLINALIEAGQPLVERGLVAPPRWDGLLSLRGVMLSEAAAEVSDAERVETVRAGLEPALDALVESRAQEGRALTALLGSLLDELARLTATARDVATAQPAALAERMRQRLSALVGEVGVDPQRIAQEVALLAAKADVREELDRLDAHIAEARALIAGDDAAGRRLDFLTQELNREANTLCSKSNELALTRIGLDLKTAIDQIREQAANVE